MLSFPGLGLTLGLRINSNRSFNMSYLFVAFTLLFLNGCTAHQIDKFLDKIPNGNGSSYGGEPSYETVPSYDPVPSHEPAGHNSPAVSAIPKIIYFKAEPPFVISGSSTTLKWRTDDVTSAQIVGLGPVTVTGNREVSPNQQKTYELVATNSVGQTVRDEIKIPVAVPMIGEPPNNFKIRAVKRFNILNPKKKIAITSKNLNKIKLKHFPLTPVVVDPQRLRPHRSTCASHVQGKIAWDYNGKKRWAQNNITRLCKGAEQSPEPARCFKRVMHGGINWGGSTKWKWNNALDLCEGSINANSTIACFQRDIRNRRNWQRAIRNCSK